MKLIRIIIVITVLSILVQALSGCYNDDFLKAMNEEEDFIAPFDVILNDNDTTRTVYFSIPDTGNAASYCAGDDGSFTDIPVARSFSDRLVASDKVVDDNVTGLTWTKCTSDGFKSMGCTGGVEQTWDDAFTTCDTLTYAGYSDWRLPTLPELFTLLYFGGSSYADQSVFPDTEISQIASPAIHEPFYWTSTSRLFLSTGSFSVTDYGWVVYFNGGPYVAPPYNYKFQITNFVEKRHYDSGTGVTTPAMGFVRCVRRGL